METYFKFIIFLLFVVCCQIGGCRCENQINEGIPQENCDGNSYRCKNNVCINESLICDGKRDCPEGDDEEGCVVAADNSSITCAKTTGQCHCYRTTIFLSLDCLGSGLISIPKLTVSYRERVSKIAITGAKIPKLTSRSFDGTKYLRNLTLKYNEIAAIENDTFAGIGIPDWMYRTPLDALDLTGNNLTKLTPEMFKPTIGFSRLILANNGINEIENDTFSDLELRYTLDLSGNKITNLRPGMFNGVNCRDLMLQNNEISTIAPYTFSGNDKVQELNLAGNKITKLTSQTFDGLSEVHRLNLQGNEIDTIENYTFHAFSIIFDLNLRDNKLTTLTPVTFNTAPRPLGILSIDLRGNQINTVENYTFSKIQELKTLDLSLNRLTELPSYAFRELTKLSNLSLSENEISQIHPSTFAGLPWLQSLNLTGNPLHDIDTRTLFYYNDRLNYLYVDDTRLCCGTNIPECNPGTGRKYQIYSCEPLSTTTDTSNKLYIAVGVLLLVASIVIVIILLKFTICKINGKSSRQTYAAPIAQHEL